MRHLPRIILAVLALAFATLVGLALLRALDNRHIETQWRALDGRPGEEVFEPAQLARLPAPAQRYFRWAIDRGTPLASTVRLRMQGRVNVPGREDPVNLVASQILNPTRGYVWEARIRTGTGFLSASDSFVDGEGRTRLLFMGLVPYGEFSGPEFARSSTERLALEAIWCPSALLPARGATWEAIDHFQARVHVPVQGQRIPLLLTIDERGRLRQVLVERYDARALHGGERGYVPFGLEILDERTFDGYTIPSRIRGGWHFATPRYEEVLDVVLVDAWFK